MAITSAQQSAVFKLAVGLFNAAPGGFYNSVAGILLSSKDAAAAADALIATDAFQAIIPSNLLTNDQFAARLVENLVGNNATAANKAWAAAQIVGQLNSGSSQGTAAYWAIDALSKVPTSDSNWGNAAAALLNKISVAQYFTVDAPVTSQNLATLQGLLIDVTADLGSIAVAKTAGTTSINLSTAVETTNGTAGNDTFKAFLANGADTLQSGDVIRGGAGTDTLIADVSSQNRNGEPNENAIAFESQSVEKVTLRSQHQENTQNNGDNNLHDTRVAIDAERAAGVGTWTDYNSRADLIIEDVRIADGLKTKDVTLVMESTDPGNVDFGVYFDQHSLRNSSSSSTTLTIKLMDTGAAGNAATAATPLLNNPYDQFKLGLNGVLTTIQLDKAAVAAADTYEALLTVFQNALASTAGVTVALGNTFTITDPISNKSVTGKEIVLTGSSGIAISAPAGSGWYNTTGASVPPTSNIYTTYSDATSSVAELVTSTIVLDDVGRGSTGGDLLVGGLSVGETSTSRGVERFEIEVRDSSKLQTINSTNNALREVTIVSGKTSNSSSAYNTVVTDKGNLTVNGDAGNINGNQLMDGANEGSVYGTHQGVGAAGFTDVRLIDASAFNGKLAFTAAITGDSITKYVNQVDTQANPTADVAGSGNVNFNVKGANFIYTGGTNDDTMSVTIDGGVAASRSTVVAGQSDFTFNINGGTGSDVITVAVINPALAGGAQAWYNNQKLNANIIVNGGDGDDTIRTPGAGDKIIDAGTGNDVVYTDNTGVLTTAVANGAASAAALAYSNDSAAELAAANAAYVASNTTGFVRVAGTEAGGSDFVTTAAAAAALNTLNLITPVAYDAATAPTYTAVQNGINAAVAAGGLTFAQAIALETAYQTYTTARVVTPAATMVDQALSGGTANATMGAVISAANFAAGNTLLDTYIAAAKSAAAAATANDLNKVNTAAVLNGTQLAVANATDAVNRVYDPTAVSGLTFTVGAITQGANETNTFTIGALAAGDTIIINGVTYTGAGGGATAAQAAAAIVGGVSTAQVTVAGAPGAGWTVAAGAGTDVVYTSTATGNPADLANTGTSAATPAAPVVVNAIAEVVPVAITGTGLAGQTVTFDGVTHNVAGLNAAAVAALIDGAADGATFTDAAAGAVLTLTAATAGVLADVTAGSFVSAKAAGTQTTVNNLAALSSALVVGATDAQVVTALQAAIDNGAISSASATALFGAAVAAAGTVDATELANAQAILVPLQTTAANANTAAQATLTAALAADATAVNTAANTYATAPATLAAADVTEAATALAALNTYNTGWHSPLTAQSTGLASLKSAISAGTTDLAVVTATANAVAAGVISAGDKTAIDTAATAVTGVVGTPVTATEKTAVDLLITALQLTNETALAHATLTSANLKAISDAAATASTISTAAANSGGNSLFTGNQKAVYVFDTSNQAASYNAATMDDRNLADLKSDVNNTNNFFNSTVKVTYKGLDASVIVAGTGYKTTDLEINQAIKQAINTDAVLSKLLLATDGPANSLVVTSLIDGTHTTGNLAVTVTLPTAVTLADVAGAATAYGLAAGATDAQVLAAMTTAKTAFDAKGDYATQFAESGAAGGNVTLTGANSVSSSDNTVTPGTGNDVIVLGTTVGTDLMTSSNEVVKYSGSFGNDTIVNFAATGLGIDVLDFSSLGGRGTAALNSLSADKSIVIAAEAATPLTTTQIAALFTDSATAMTHVYVAYNSNNIGSVYTVTDAAGTAAGNVTATLVGTIDLADTGWATLTAANFG